MSRQVRMVEGKRARRVLERLRDRHEAIGEEAFDRIWSETPGYASVRDEATLEVFRDRAAEFIERFVRWTESGELGDEDRRFISEEGARTAQLLIPLESMMEAVRAGQRFLWDLVVLEAGDDAEGKAAALEVLASVVRFTDLVTRVLTEGYLSEQQQRSVEDDRVRRDVLEALLAGRPNAAGRLSDVGFPADGQSAIVVAGLADEDADASEGLRALHLALSRSLTDTPKLMVVRFDEVVGLLSVRDRSRTRAELIGAAETMREGRGVDAAVGLSTVTRGVEEVPRRYDEARRALAVARIREQPVAAIDDVPLLDQLLLRADASTESVVPRSVRELVEEDLDHEGVLVRTLLAYVDADMNVPRAAEELIVHPNTVHYRLKRIGEITGRNTRSFSDLVELVIGVRLVRERRREGVPDR